VISGNKFRKLKYILEDFYSSGKNKIIAFGGAYSNLLHSLSLVTKYLEVEAQFIVRGEDNENPTLNFVRKNGVKVVFWSRENFKKIREENFIEEFQNQNPESYIIPEGASNLLATFGSSEIYSEVLSQLDFSPDYMVLDLGTGGTFAGVLSKITANTTKLIGIPVLKGVNWNKTLTQILENETIVKNNNFQIFEDYHFGGFAKYNIELIDFINDFKLRFGIDIDPIYTGKLIYGFFDLLNKGFFDKNSNIVLVHSGGNQGINGFNLAHENILL
jgi:1-aminocyclopropane-1-carboxylate deaminase